MRALAYFGEHWITVLPVYSMEPKPVGRRVRRSFCHPRDDQSNLRGYRRRKVLNAGGFSGQPQSAGSSLPLHLGYQLGIPHSRLRLGSVYVLLLVETRLRELVEVKGQEQYKKFPTCSAYSSDTEKKKNLDILVVVVFQVRAANLGNPSGPNFLEDWTFCG